MSIRVPPSAGLLPVALVILASALWVSATDQEAFLAPSLADLSNPAKTLTATQLRDLAEDGVRHPSASVRRQALQGVAERLRLAQFRGGLDSDLTVSDAREGFDAVRPFIESSLTDPDESVRHAAVVALGALGVSGSARAPLLERPTLALFANALSSESSAMVRAEIMKVVALTPAADRLLRHEILTRGLESDVPAVVQYALRGVSDDRLESAAPRVVELLRHDDRAVRLLAAGTLHGYGGLARAYLPAVRAAHAAEIDVSTKNLLESLHVHGRDQSRNHSANGIDGDRGSASLDYAVGC